VSALEAVQETIVPVGAPAHAERALQGLYERHSERIFGFCRRRLRSHQEAEDAMQTTFLQAFRALQRGVVPVSEEAWLFKIAENVCLSAHRSNGRRSERELADGAAAIELAPARESEAGALVGLDEALAAIPRRQRDVFVLRELRGLSYKEIAVSLELSVTSVEMLMFRARRSLARELENGSGLKGRIASIFDLAAVLNALKTAFGGASAAKAVSAAVAVVAVAALPAGDSARRTPSGATTIAATRSTVQPTTPRATPRRTAARQSAVEPQRSAGDGRRLDSRPDSSHRSSPRRPRPGGEPQVVPEAPPASGVPAAPQPPVAPPPPTAPALEPPAAPAPIQLPQPPPVEVPQLPELPQLPQLPVEVPTLPDPLPDPGELDLDLPATPTLP
jgi:RNA polymerase sigma-70 factor, ECF subfamily